MTFQALCRASDAPCEANATLELRTPMPARWSAGSLGWPAGAGLELRFERDEDAARYAENADAPEIRIQATSRSGRAASPAVPAARRRQGDQQA